MGGVVSSLVPSLFLPGDYTIATLPSASMYNKMYAWVIDLHDGQPDRVVSDGTYWKPVRPLATKIVTNANSNMTLSALSNSPTQILQGSLTASRNVTINTTNAYPGARFRVKREATGLFSILVNTVGLSLGSWMDMEYDGTQWVQTASGGLL